MLLPTWPRPNFTPNAGQPFLLFAAFGDLDLAVPVDRPKYRAAGVPGGCELLLYSAAAQPSVFQQLQATDSWKAAAEEAPELAKQAADAKQFAWLRGHVRKSVNLDYLRDAVGIVQYLFDRGAVAVYDPHTLQFWSAADWQSRLFEPAAPVPHEHVLILENEDTHGSWIHTRGLRKFGRPDLSVKGVHADYRDKVIDLFNHYLDYLASGGTILSGDRVTLPGLPAGGVFQLDPKLDHDVFHNCHAECVWDDGAISRPPE